MRDDQRKIWRMASKKYYWKNRDKILNIQKIDKKEDIENKIIEFIVGSRLRTDAIRGLNLGENQDDSNSKRN